MPRTILTEVFFDKTDYSEVMAFSSIEEAVNNTFGEYEAIGFVIAVWRDPETGIVYSESAEEDFDAAWEKCETERLTEKYNDTYAAGHTQSHNDFWRDKFIACERKGVPVRRGLNAEQLKASTVSRGFSADTINIQAAE